MGIVDNLYSTIGQADRRTIDQADQGPSIRRTKNYWLGGSLFMKTTDRTHDPSVGRPHQNLDQ